ncbi:hypothetical protein T459_14409 [Capsicum annuum]|uniref:Ubiquitin-like protease family profile domain-containing protein n=1 Tax=Capsicum annuum TaxID=4072 RepID=A0A2G2ZHH4_CAPAN|nr:hypothetical protein T459_14409 [Capsicum annuum]
MLKAIEQSKISDEKINEINLSDSVFTIPDELLPSLNAFRRESITAYPSKTYEEEPTDEHLNDKKSESIVEDHFQTNKENVGLSSKLEMHAEVDLGREDKITKPPKIQEVTTDEQKDDRFWPDSQNVILDELLSSLNAYSIKSIIVHPSANRHYLIVLAKIEKLAEIIPLCLQACDFYDKKGIDLQNHPRYKDKDSSVMFDVLFEENLPQQPSESLNCGVYMVTYAECLSYGHKILSIDFDPNALRKRYVALLWDYGIRKQEENTHSDIEATLRPAR